MKIVTRTRGKVRLETTDFPSGCRRSVAGALRLPRGVTVTVTDDECEHLLALGIPLSVHDGDPPVPAKPIVVATPAPMTKRTKFSERGGTPPPKFRKE